MILGFVRYDTPSFADVNGYRDVRVAGGKMLVLFPLFASERFRPASRGE